MRPDAEHTFRCSSVRFNVEPHSKTRWLEDWLESFDGSIICTSHFSPFLDKMCILAVQRTHCTSGNVRCRNLMYSGSLHREQGP